MKLTETKQLNLSALVESVLSIIVRILKDICDSSYLSPFMYFAATSRNVHVFQRVLSLHTFHWLFYSTSPSIALNFTSTWHTGLFQCLSTKAEIAHCILGTQVQRKEQLS